MDSGDGDEDDSFHFFCCVLLQKLHAAGYPAAQQLPDVLQTPILVLRATEYQKMAMMDVFGIDMLTVLSHRWKKNCMGAVSQRRWDWEHETVRAAAIWERIGQGEQWRILIDEEEQEQAAAVVIETGMASGHSAPQSDSHTSPDNEQLPSLPPHCLHWLRCRP